MAEQPFEKRARTALENKLFRLSDFPSLIAEADELGQQQRALAAQASGESLDFGLSEADREEAAAKADRARRNAATFAAAAEALKARFAERQASERAKKGDTERAAALAERDALAERFRAIVPDAVETLKALLAEVIANEERMRAAGMSDASAEAVARGVPGNWTVDHSELRRFTQMAIPAWSQPGRQWPLGEGFSPLQDYERQRKEIARKVRADAAAREVARFGWYRIKAPGGRGISFDARIPGHLQLKPRMLSKGEWQGEIEHGEAARLRTTGVTVEETTREKAEAWAMAKAVADAEAEARSGVYYPRRDFVA